MKKNHDRFQYNLNDGWFNGQFVWESIFPKQSEWVSEWVSACVGGGFMPSCKGDKF